MRSIVHAFCLAALVAAVGPAWAQAPDAGSAERLSPVAAVARAGTGIQATWTGLRQRVGTRAVARGRVTGRERAHRLVRLVTPVPGGVRELARTRTSRSGAFVLVRANTWLGHRRVRLQVVGTATSSPASTPWTVSHVRPAYRPPGSARDRRLMGGTPGRYRLDPCRPVTWRLNDSSGRHLADAREGFRRLAVATGLQFRYLGRTRHDPAVTRGWPADTAIILGLGPDRATAWPMRGYNGWATPRSVSIARNAAGAAVVRIRTAGAWVNTGYVTRRGYGVGGQLGHVILHELGHTVGLLHADQSTQQMGPYSDRRPARWGAGDLAGLHAVGLAHGCLTTAADAVVYSGGGIDDPPAARAAFRDVGRH